MEITTASAARQNFFKIMERLNNYGGEVIVAGKKGNMVMMSEEEWRSWKETVYLASIPGMTESIVKGMKEPLGKCTKIEDLDW